MSESDTTKSESDPRVRPSAAGSAQGSIPLGSDSEGPSRTPSPSRKEYQAYLALARWAPGPPTGRRERCGPTVTTRLGIS